MTVVHRLRSIADAGHLSVAAPYAEKSDRRENRLDSTLLSAWGRASPYLLSVFGLGQCERLAQSVEVREKQVIDLPDERLRRTADELRGRLASACDNSDQTALAF